ncbi:MAG: 4,5-dihydroxyphthalate decarboxylase [Hyphomicrobiales bacterium]|nr:4,5-dihydroxyphthalate decarboxylase [Hyphomicrobiales bacterium]
MSKVPLTIAVSHYDHVADVLSGRVPVQGIDLNVLDLPLHDIFYRFVQYKEFDVAEISMAKYVSMISQGDDALIALPIFPSRVLRHSAIYVRSDGPVKTPTDLNGRRIGVPEWAQTAGVYARGLLVDEFKIDIASIDWVQAGQDQPGRHEKVPLKLPPGVSVRSVPDKSLADMLIDGELDAILAAQPPVRYLDGHPNIARMFPDWLSAEQQYAERTKILPIMHTVAMRKEIIERHPWTAVNIFNAFEEAKRRSVERVLYAGMTYVPILWGFEHANRTKKLFGSEYWPYGVEANRPTLQTFLRYAYDQGVCHRLLEVEELFPPGVLGSYRV